MPGMHDYRNLSASGFQSHPVSFNKYQYRRAYPGDSGFMQKQFTFRTATSLV
jgi:hypothetical protein